MSIQHTLSQLHNTTTANIKKATAKQHYLELDSTPRLIAEATDDLMNQIHALGLAPENFQQSNSDISWDNRLLQPTIHIGYSSAKSPEGLYDALLGHPEASLNWEGSRIRVDLTSRKSFVIASTYITAPLPADDHDILLRIGRIQHETTTSTYTTC